jgi:hypothetical protein
LLPWEKQWKKSSGKVLIHHVLLLEVPMQGKGSILQQTTVHGRFDVDMIILPEVSYPRRFDVDMLCSIS